MFGRGRRRFAWQITHLTIGPPHPFLEQEETPASYRYSFRDYVDSLELKTLRSSSVSVCLCFLVHFLHLSLLPCTCSGTSSAFPPIARAFFCDFLSLLWSCEFSLKTAEILLMWVYYSTIQTLQVDYLHRESFCNWRLQCVQCFCQANYSSDRMS